LLGFLWSKRIEVGNDLVKEQGSLLSTVENVNEEAYR